MKMLTQSRNPGLLDEYLTDAELAKELGVTVRTVKGWRTQGAGPAVTRVGKRPMTSREAVRKWLEEKKGA